MFFVPHDWRLALATVVLAGLIDVVLGEPPNALHPVVWMGRLIGALERRRPRSRPGAEFAYGVLIVIVTAGAAFAAGLVLTLVLGRLPWWLALPVGACVLKTTFSLRGLVRAGRDVQRALASDTAAARASLAALVSRSPDLDPPLIVSATIESLAENLTDSVVSPLLYYALFGLPGALAYRAINTMDAMLGYRDHREYVGKAAARSDDAANWLPTRITGLLLVAVSALKGTAGRAWWAFRTQHQPQYGPNKTLAIATMAGSLGVQLQKPGAYALGVAGRALTGDVIDDAVWRVWAVGGATLALAAGLAALLDLGGAGISAARPGRDAARPALLRTVIASVHGAVDPSALRTEGVDPAGIVDFSSNQSPLGAASGVAAAVAGAVVDAYPDPHATELAAALAARHGVDPEQVVCGNGSTELIRLIAQLALGPGHVAVALSPVFGECEVATALAGARLERVPLAHAGEGAGFFCDEPALHAILGRLRPRLCWLCSPNNPTGAALPPALVSALTAEHPGTLFVLDEAYCDLLPEPQWERDSLGHGNLVVLHSMTKYWGLAGLRLGHAVADAPSAAALRAAAPPWRVNACAQAAGLTALAELEHHDAAVALLVAERDRLVAGLRELGWVTEPTTAGFFLIHAGDAAAARAALLARGCLVRDLSSFGLPEHIRVSPRRPEQNDVLLEAFSSLAPPARRPAESSR